MDLLTSFFYFNLITIRFEMPKQLNNMKRHNPNLLKQFLRHYPQLAKEKKYDVDSEEEDYTESVTKLDSIKP